MRHVSTCWVWVILGLSAAAVGAAEPTLKVDIVPNFHPACCGWLTDFSTERNYCANTYLDHLDRVRDDPSYAFVLSEVPNMVAILNFHPERVEELKARIKEGRVELVNAFFLEPTINLSGGEALVKCGVEGIRWQMQVLGTRPRFAWMIDVTGLNEQMAQITAGLGLDALVYCRHNPTGSNLHRTRSPDGSHVLTVSPGHYSEWNPVFTSEVPLGKEALSALLADVRERANPTPLTPQQVEQLARNIWGGQPQRTPPGTPVLILAGSGDYSLAPRYKGYPAELLKQLKELAPELELRFTTLGKYVDEVMPLARQGKVNLPVLLGGTSFSFNAFWIQSPRIKSWFRRCEHALQAAESLAAISSLRSKREYPVAALHGAWIQLLLNMDRNSLWGAAGGMVFEHEKSWDVTDRYESVEATARKTLEDAARGLLPEGSGLALFNPLNWERKDPFWVELPQGRSLAKVTSERPAEGTLLLCQAALPSAGTAGFDVVAEASQAAKAVDLPKEIETQHYTARIDPVTGALVSLKLGGREMLGGPANVVVAERPKRQEGDPGDHIVDRPERERLSWSEVRPEISVTSGPISTTVVARSKFFGGGACTRTLRFYRDCPRIDFETELEEIPDRTVVVAEFPLAEDIQEVRRGIPFGFSHGAWAAPQAQLHGWTKGIVPAVRWSHYQLAGGGGVALFDKGLSGRELNGRTPIIFLLNATEKYYGYPNPWLSGRGKHRLSYALLAHANPWMEARIPQRAWEYNCPPIVVPGRASVKPESFVQTSQNVIVEAMRREGSYLELRLGECLGQAGVASVGLKLPHGSGFLTNLVGGDPIAVPSTQAGDVTTYRFPVRPQQIVTMRFATEAPVADVQPIVDWNPLVPESKRAALNTKLDKKGHPPRG